jgi:hypothetical protein
MTIWRQQYQSMPGITEAHNLNEAIIDVRWSELLLHTARRN